MVANVTVWGRDLIEPGTIEQAYRTARVPVVEGVALMPDAHVGIGATVGSVVATRGAIIPAAVGVDIGCGMAAARLDVTASQLPDTLDRLMPHLAKAVPAGVGVGHDRHLGEAGAWLDANAGRFSAPLTDRLGRKALDQFGSLGSGNHFFEVDLDETDQVWLVVHSGSRGLGNIMGTEHIKATSELARAAGMKLEDKDLAWLEEGTHEFAMYIADMLACQDYAAANRAQMMRRALDAFVAWFGAPVAVLDEINCHHNFAERRGDAPGDAVHTRPETNQQHRAVYEPAHSAWITRKGAIAANAGQRGIIPGSMGDRTFVVEGLGNPASYCSCSHGAGRTMSRAKAKRELTTSSLQAHMADREIVWNSDKPDALLDEHPSAYKPIDAVMAAQADLVRPLHTLRQILNQKGQ